MSALDARKPLMDVSTLTTNENLLRYVSIIASDKAHCHFSLSSWRHPEYRVIKGQNPEAE